MTQNKLLNLLARKFDGELKFEPSKSYYWSPTDSTVYFQAGDTSEVGLWTILHETCHGLLKHTNYSSDFELVLLEANAWQEAEKLSGDFGIEISDEHVQDCLDSYRDWQYKRSLCPKCDLGGVQTDQKTYSCMFCDGNWKVSSARFCRPYRKRQTL